MITNIEEIPVTKSSYPFSSAERYCGLSERGYVEREYYVRGTANVYETVGEAGEVAVSVRDAPYVNRCLVRAPANPADASGNVMVEIINPTSFMDIDRMWILGRAELVRSGDIYVGITSKPNTIAKLVEFDKGRYGCLSWANPTPERPLPFDSEKLVRGGALPDIDLRYEPGLVWDMLTDLARVLRADGPLNPIRGYPREAICLTGWSQSASYLFRYLNSFAYRPEVREGGPVYDGYLAGGGVHSLVIPVSQYEAARPYAPELRRVEHAEEPFVAVQTESENALMEGWRTAMPDSDSPRFRYRLYEAAGSSHDTTYSYLDYYGGDEDLERIGMLPRYVGLHEEPNAYPSQILFAAAFRNLFRWVRTGVAPAPCPRIPVTSEGVNARDAFGNAKGGLRTCLLDYPTARYANYSNVVPGTGTVDKASGVDILFGHQERFSAGMLRELYGTLDHYRTLCEENTAEQVSRGYVCREDASELVRLAVDQARASGLS